jgi:hypothetical protein
MHFEDLHPRTEAALKAQASPLSCVLPLHHLAVSPFDFLSAPAFLFVSSLAQLYVGWLRSPCPRPPVDLSAYRCKRYEVARRVSSCNRYARYSYRYARYARYTRRTG